MFKHEFEYKVGDLVMRKGYDDSPKMVVDMIAVDVSGEIYSMNWFLADGGTKQLWLRPAEIEASNK